MQKRNWVQWIQIKGEKIAHHQLQHVKNDYPETSIEHSVLSFSQLWLNNTSVFTHQSSGSTGTPKNLKINRSQMQASAAATVSSLGLRAGDTALLSISADFIGGKMMIVRALEHNLNLIVGDVSANPLMHLQSDQEIDFFSFVPYQFSKILESKDMSSINRLNKAKAIILGGAAVDKTLEIAIKNLIATPVYSTYGMTETVSHVALKRLNGMEDEHFEALQGTHFSQDKRSCLVIHAPQITGNEKLSTNDVVQLIDDQHFEWLGRYDFVINSGGIKLHPEQIELRIEKLLKVAGIRNSFFVFGQPDVQFGSRLCLITEGPTNKITLMALLKKQLEPYEVPKAIFETNQFRKTKSDKLNRKATLKMAGIDYT
jgi:O-succinylbenzoic acid--CoA ligase